ncbi:hypothetical protein [Bacillus sp. JCM 19041]|uniref:hypothetical protein n=1 Tax=Bacillus sp. JCM 19041 TaxID=1460637 RepID=UPI000AF55774
MPNEPELIGILAMIALLILFLIRTPVAVALLLVGIFGIAPFVIGTHPLPN